MCKKTALTIGLYLIICCFLCQMQFPCFAVTSSAEATVLMIAGSDEVIFSENADKRMSMASTTKIMTALLCLEYGELDKEITATDEMVTVEGTSIGLQSGDIISLRELVYGMLLESGNDAANAAAFAVSGDIDSFLELMNRKAQEIGMINTRFATVSGLDADGHYTTAYDMALLTSYALENAEFRKICSSYTKTVTYGNPPYARRFVNHNKLLKLYDGAIGVKTGYTKKSGRCLISAAERDSATLICVTLRDSDDWNNHQRLLDYGFSAVIRSETDISRSFCLSAGGGDSSAAVAVPEYIPSFFSLGKFIKINEKVEISPFVLAPAEKGDIVGRVTYYYENGRKACEVPLIIENDIKCNTQENSYYKIGLIDRIINFFKGDGNVRQ